jgi:glyceraldehyde-3-phosphate dehydrogenase (NADP+)
MKIHAEEVFGPVVCVNVYSELDEVISEVNDSRFGLQASVFTDSKRVLDACFDQLEVGAVIHNESTLFRVDHMPYGGVKDSGLGREGVRYAMLDFLEPRLLVE